MKDRETRYVYLAVRINVCLLSQSRYCNKILLSTLLESCVPFLRSKVKQGLVPCLSDSIRHCLQ